jgi:hypothetical protein
MNTNISPKRTSHSFGIQILYLDSKAVPLGILYLICIYICVHILATIRLPFCKKLWIYDEYKVHKRSNTERINNVSYFNHIWRVYFPLVKVQQFSKNKSCEDCANFYRRLGNTKDKTTRAIIMGERATHMNAV